MSFDWSYFTDFDDTTIILKEFTKRDLALLSSAMSLFELETDWINGTWDTIEQKLSEIQWRLSHDTYVCPPGGDADYILQDEIELLSDATTVTLSDLDLIDGRDLRIEVHGINTGGAARHLRMQINGLTSNVYDYAIEHFRTSVTFYTGISTLFQMRDCLEESTTPQRAFGFVTIDIPLWKDTDTYPLIRAAWNGDGNNGNGHAKVLSATGVESATFFSSSGDLKTGTKFVIYSRGS